ncbi:DNA repair protein [Streptococcus parasuis]|uniref:DNA repair protein n=1 Tax=Streptococcus parasuis TaxID=1501662 RepID=UPI002FD8B17A
MKFGLRKLRRTDLLELLVSQAERIETLEAQVADLQEKLEDKQIILENAGSIAKAALQVNRIFETAQQTADQYLASVKRLADKSVLENEEQ